MHEKNSKNGQNEKQTLGKAEKDRKNKQVRRRAGYRIYQRDGSEGKYAAWAQVLKHEMQRARNRQRQKRGAEGSGSEYYSVTIIAGHPSAMFVTGAGRGGADSWLYD